MHHCGFIQELCIADNNMVVPMQLRLPSEQQQTRKKLHDSAVALQSRMWFKPCFSCHDITFDKKQTKAFDVSCSLWRGVYACKKMRVITALQRFTSTDVLGMRWRFLRSPSSFDEEEMNGNQRRRDGALAAPWCLCGFWGK